VIRVLLRLIALLVPRPARPRWREEWLAEMDEIARVRGRLAKLRAVTGAIPDAVAMRRSTPSAPGSRPVPQLFRGIVEDFKYAGRSLLKSPAFALSVAGSLSLGIAAMIAPFTFLNALFFRSFPGVYEQHQVVKLALTRTCGRPDCLVSSSTLEDYRALREGMTTLTGLAAQASDSIAVTIEGRAYSLRAAMVSDNYFDSLGVRPALGRAFIPGKDDADADNTVVIADTLWRREFGASPNVLGRSVSLGASGSARIIGVAPTGFVGISRGDVGIVGPGIELWVALSRGQRVFPPERRPEGPLPEDERHFIYSGRLREGVTEADVQAQATLVAARIQATRPQERAGAAATVSPVTWFSGPRMAFIGAVLSIPLLVLAIGCLNATNMLLARGTQRAREMAVRLALGATRWRIVRQLLVESMFLALIATLAALPIVWWAISVIESYVALPMPVDGRVAAFASGMALMSAVASSVGPSLRLSATRPGAALGSSRAGDESPSRARTRRIQVVAQIAASLALLATGAQLISFLPAQAQSAGTPPDRLLMASFDVGQLRMSRAEGETFYRRLLERVSALPEADGAGLARKTALWTFGRGKGSSGIAVLRLEDRPGSGVVGIGGYAGGELFRAAGLRVIQGRAFTRDDEGPRPRVAILNRPLADRLFGGHGLGQTIRVFPTRRPSTEAIEVTVVGIVEPSLEPSYSRQPVAGVYLPVSLGEEPQLTLYVRAKGSPLALADGIRRAVSAIDSRVPPIELRTLADISGDRQFPERLAAQSVSLLGVIGLLLATAGIYGVMSYFVSFRSREIGVRLALGADPASVLRMTLREAMRLAVLGAIIGGVAALVTSKMVQSGMYGVKGLDLPYLAGSFLLLAAAMLVASAVPAYRASRVDPITVLRQE
jgi:putative ABC transport system permease protein